MFTRRESIVFSSGRITWLLTCVVQSVTLIDMQERQVPHRTNGRRDYAIEKRCKFEGEHGLAHKVTEVPS